MFVNKKLIVHSAIFGLIVLALFVFIVFPLFKTVKRQGEELATIKKDLFLTEKRVDSFEEIKKTYQDYEADLERIEGLFVDPEVPIDLIKFWEKTAALSEVSISISPISRKKAEADKWGSMGFQIGLTGSFSDFLKFLQKIENGPYLIEIQGLSVKELTEREVKLTGDKKISSGGVSIDLAVKVFTK